MLDLNWDNENYTLAYDMVTYYKEVFDGKMPLMYIFPKQFIDAKTLFAINLTK